MRKIWVKVDPWDKNLVTTALENGADGVMVPEGYSQKVRELGRIQTISEDGDIKVGEDVVFFTIRSGEDEEEILSLSRTRKVVLLSEDWTIIPLENLISRGADVIAQVCSLQEAQTAFGILEKGVQRILIVMNDPVELKQALTVLRSAEEPIELMPAEVVDVRPAGMGDRVCIDTCTVMTPGQGTLVGNSSRFLFLVHSESLENPYVAARPFRINAGPVHAYTRVPGGRTRYLSELEAGDPVLIVDHQGTAIQSTVGRLKIEKRPLVLITAEADGQRATVLLQNAETVRLTGVDGEAISVADLKKGDRVLAAPEAAGRHFGYRITESITEK